jgi:hypothetical protein
VKRIRLRDGRIWRRRLWAARDRRICGSLPCSIIRTFSRRVRRASIIKTLLTAVVVNRTEDWEPFRAAMPLNEKRDIFAFSVEDPPKDYATAKARVCQIFPIDPIPAALTVMFHP